MRATRDTSAYLARLTVPWPCAREAHAFVLGALLADLLLHACCACRLIRAQATQQKAQARRCHGEIVLIYLRLVDARRLQLLPHLRFSGLESSRPYASKPNEGEGDKTKDGIVWELGDGERSGDSAHSPYAWVPPPPKSSRARPSRADCCAQHWRCTRLRWSEHMPAALR